MTPEVAEFVRRATELVQGGSFEAAIEPAEQALRIDPDCVDAYSILGIAYSRSGKPQLAENALRQVIQRRPDAKAHYNLAAHLFAAGDRIGAEEEARTALTLDGSHEAAAALLRSLSWEREQPGPVGTPQPFGAYAAPEAPKPYAFVEGLGWSWTLLGCFFMAAYVATRSILLVRFASSVEGVDSAKMTETQALTIFSELFSKNASLMIGALVWLMLLCSWWIIDYAHWQRRSLLAYVVVGILDAVILMCCTYGVALVVMFTIYVWLSRRPPSYPPNYR